MSSVSIISTTQQSIFATAGKSVAQQTVATVPPQPTANASSVTISQAALDALAADVANTTQQSTSVTTGQKTVSAQSQSSVETSNSAIPANSSPAFKQGMAEKFAGGNEMNAIIKNDPSNPMWAKDVDSYAQHDFTAGTEVLYDISHTMPGASGNPKIDGILRYSSGEPVTAESQAYVTQQTADYQNQLREMISSEKAKGTAPSDILLKIADLQGQQPARFRSMMEWPVASDFTNPQSG